MKPSDFQVSWFDLVALAMLVVGLVRGRKRGISEELLEVIQWVLIVFAGAFLYQPLSRLLVSTSGVFGQTLTAVIVYLLIAMILKLIFSFFKRSIGEKLVESEAFGDLEYYLGMGAGLVRFACMLMFALALLNAKYISPADLAADAKRQQDYFGSISFPTIGSLQQAVFRESWTGRMTKQHLDMLLINVGPDDTRKGRENVFKSRQRTVDEVLRAK